MLPFLPTPSQLGQDIPLSRPQQAFISESRKAITQILSGKDPRLLLIVGPCSIHHMNAALEYAQKLNTLAKEVSPLFFLVMRTYFEKPRTIKGWKGFLYDPHLDGSNDLAAGLRLSRQLLSELADLRIPCGSEFLDILTSVYYSDYISWGCIGARTSTSQPHRQLASDLALPVGFKNTMDGNVDNAVHAILSASLPHTFLKIGEDGRLVQANSVGNGKCHVILRGSQNGFNYTRECVERAALKCQEAGILNQIVVDCSHDNCRKYHRLQIEAFETTLAQIAEGSLPISGLMLESFLMEGNQPLERSPHPKISVTDPCLDWDTTESLIHSAFDILEKRVLTSIG